MTSARDDRGSRGEPIRHITGLGLLRLARSGKPIGAVGLCLFLLASSTARADDQRLEPRQTMLLLFKALTYDENVSRGRSEIRVGVLSAEGNAQSLKRGREVMGWIGKLSSMKLRGLQVSGVHLPISASSELENLAESKGANILYLGPALKAVDQICRLAQKRRWLVISGEPDHAKGCAALNVLRRDHKAVILLNPKAARAQGAAFNDRLTPMAVIVK